MAKAVNLAKKLCTIMKSNLHTNTNELEKEKIKMVKGIVKALVMGGIAVAGSLANSNAESIGTWADNGVHNLVDKLTKKTPEIVPDTTTEEVVDIVEDTTEE